MDKLRSDTKSATYQPCMVLDKVYQLSKPWFPHLTNGDNSTHLIGLLGGLSDIVSVKCLAQCLAHSVQKKMVATIICRVGMIPPITQDSEEDYITNKGKNLADVVALCIFSCRYSLGKQKSKYY